MNPPRWRVETEINAKFVMWSWFQKYMALLQVEAIDYAFKFSKGSSILT